jgi:hypothetical protein
MKYEQVNIGVPKDTFPCTRYEREDYQFLRKYKCQVVTDVFH